MYIYIYICVCIYIYMYIYKYKYVHIHVYNELNSHIYISGHRKRGSIRAQSGAALRLFTYTYIWYMYT